MGVEDTAVIAEFGVASANPRGEDQRYDLLITCPLSGPDGVPCPWQEYSEGNTLRGLTAQAREHLRAGHPAEQCRAFNWFGPRAGDLSKCATCSRPAWEHDGWFHAGDLKPWGQGELEAVRDAARRKGLLQ